MKSNNFTDLEPLPQQNLYVEISSASPIPTGYRLYAEQLDHFFLETGVPLRLNATPSEPQFVEYAMPDGVDRVLVQLKALEPEHFCSFFSVQPVQCPVADLESELRIQGKLNVLFVSLCLIMKLLPNLKRLPSFFLSLFSTVVSVLYRFRFNYSDRSF